MNNKILFLNIWYKCNFDCVYCVIWWIQNEFSSDDFVSIEKIKNINYDWCKSVRLTWWEPTIHPDFFEILEFLSKKKLYIYIQTNGSMLWIEDFFNKIKKYRITYQLPLNSYLEKIHNTIMKHKNAYNLTLSWIKNLLGSKDTAFTVKIIITKLNYNHISKTIEFLISLWVKRFYIAYPVLKWNYLKYTKLVPKYSEIKKELNIISEIEEKYDIHYVLESFPYCMINENQYKNVWEISQFDKREIVKSKNKEFYKLLDISINCFKKYWNNDENRNCDICKIVKFKHKLNNISFLHKKLDKEVNANCLDNLHKIKNANCLNCKYNLICTWVSEEYINMNWFEEFDSNNVNKNINKKDIIDYFDYISKNE